MITSHHPEGQHADQASHWLGTVARFAAASGRPGRPTGTTNTDAWAAGPWDSHDLRLGPRPELLLITRNPTAEHVHHFKHAPAEFRIHLGVHVLVLTFRFGELPWSAAYWGLLEAPPEPGTHQLPDTLNDSLTVRLAVSHPDDGLIAERLSVWPAGFAATVRVAVNSALAPRANPELAYLDLARMLRECPTPEALATRSTAYVLAESAHHFRHLDRP